MNQLIIPDIKDKFSCLVNEATKEGDYFRHIWHIEGIGKHFRVIYSISYAKTYSDEERRTNMVLRSIKIVAKLLMGMPLIQSSLGPSQDTFCNLLVEVLSIEHGIIKLRYDVHINQGSWFHKKWIRESELLGIVNHNLSDMQGVEINNQDVTINLKSIAPDNNQIDKITNIKIDGNNCILDCQ